MKNLAFTLHERTQWLLPICSLPVLELGTTDQTPAWSIAIMDAKSIDYSMYASRPEPTQLACEDYPWIDYQGSGTCFDMYMRHKEPLTH